MMKNYILYIFVFFILSSCKKESNEAYLSPTCPFNEQASARYLIAPDSAETGSTIAITFVYDNQKPCQQFSHFSSMTTGNSTIVYLSTKIDTCDCSTDYTPTHLNFNYQAPSTPGHSIIQLAKMRVVQLSDTIVIY
jgi:hypothetical protein